MISLVCANRVNFGLKLRNCHFHSFTHYTDHRSIEGTTSGLSPRLCLRANTYSATTQNHKIGMPNKIQRHELDPDFITDAGTSMLPISQSRRHRSPMFRPGSVAQCKETVNIPVCIHISATVHASKYESDSLCSARWTHCGHNSQSVQSADSIVLLFHLTPHPLVHVRSDNRIHNRGARLPVDLDQLVDVFHLVDMMHNGKFCQKFFQSHSRTSSTCCWCGVLSAMTDSTSTLLHPRCR